MKSRIASMAAPTNQSDPTQCAKTAVATPTVSVIVPNYNHACFLPERFASIRSQTMQDYELIVLDDASSDDSLAVIRRELAGVPHQLILNERNSGSPCSQWLKGIQHARGRYIWIAESDDSCSSCFLSTMLEYMDQGAVLSYCRSSTIDTFGEDVSNSSFYWPDAFDSKLWKTSFSLSSAQFCNDFLSRANVIPNASAVLFHRDLATSCMSIQATLNKLLFAGDWVFWYHYLSNTNDGRVRYTPNQHSWFRSHPGTTRAISSDKARSRRHINEFCQIVTLIIRQQPEQLSTRWRRRIFTPDWDWDWILVEYINRIRPSTLELLTGKYLHGPLRYSLLFRIICSNQVRSTSFPRLSRFIYRSLLALRIGQAKIIGRLKHRHKQNS